MGEGSLLVEEEGMATLRQSYPPDTFCLTCCHIAAAWTTWERWAPSPRHRVPKHCQHWLKAYDKLAELKAGSALLNHSELLHFKPDF